MKWHWCFACTVGKVSSALTKLEWLRQHTQALGVWKPHYYIHCLSKCLSSLLLLIVIFLEVQTKIQEKYIKKQKQNRSHGLLTDFHNRKTQCSIVLYLWFTLLTLLSCLLWKRGGITGYHCEKSLVCLAMPECVCMRCWRLFDRKGFWISKVTTQHGTCMKVASQRSDLFIFIPEGREVRLKLIWRELYIRQ